MGLLVWVMLVTVMSVIVCRKGATMGRVVFVAVFGFVTLLVVGGMMRAERERTVAHCAGLKTAAYVRCWDAVLGYD